MRVGDLVRVKPKHRGHRPDVVGTIVRFEMLSTGPLALVRRVDSDRWMHAYPCDMEVISASR